MIIHDFLPISESNGYGKRFVVWVQGCNRRCEGCFNQDMLSFDGGYAISAESLFSSVPLGDVCGVSVSGGEPFEQSDELVHFFSLAHKAGLDTLAYSGYTYDELMRKPAAAAALRVTDILIDGAYEKDNPPIFSWTGSGNQRVYHLIDGKIKSEASNAGGGDGEIIIDKNGNVVATGIFDGSFLKHLL